MAETSKIAWTDSTFNPWIGCAKVSAGCANCYASVDTFARRSRANGIELWGEKAARHRTSPDYWKQPLRWNRQAERDGVRRRVFCGSLCDVAEPRPDLDPIRADLARLIEATPCLDWLLLTKRPRNYRFAFAMWGDRWPRNVWAGTTIEDFAAVEHGRDFALKQVPAVLRFYSMEPLLGRYDRMNLDGIGWVIVGGESGPHARPCDVADVRSIVHQCRAARVPVFVKQLGAYVLTRNDDGLSGCDEGDWQLADPIEQVEHDLDGYRDGYQGAPVRVHLRDPKGADMTEWPADLRVRQWPEVRR